MRSGAARTGLEALLSPRERAPVMLPAHLDTWVQTKPIPVPDPDVSLWLHGVGRKQVPEVQIVWRADISEPLLERARDSVTERARDSTTERTRDSAAEHRRESVTAAEAVRARLSACPPVGLEAISVPIDAARAWLTSDDAPDLTDVEGGAREEEEERRRGRDTRKGRPAVVWMGDDSRVISAAELRPEQTIVVPCAYGGIAPSGGASPGGSWDPSSKEPVSDLGDRARWEQTRRPTLRLHPAIVAEQAWAKAPSGADADDPDREDRDAVDEVLGEMRPSAGEGDWPARAMDALRERGKKRPAIVRLEEVVWRDAAGKAHVEPGYLVVTGRRPVARTDSLGGGEGGGVTTEDDAGSHTGVEVTLREHLAGVADWSRRFADRCGLPETVARSVEKAAAWHDAGKVDPRFQRLLRGGSESRSTVGEPIAKSRIVLADQAARRRAAERSGYPKGTRHELASLALLAENTPLLGPGVDVDLVLHLIASHHGHCRPFAPVPEGEDTEPVELVFAAEGGEVRARSDHGLERLDSGVADRFWRLVERYGWFGLAWLEAILRLADHRRSEQEQQEKPSGPAEVT